jgi:hypothetical protein
MLTGQRTCRPTPYPRSLGGRGRSTPSDRPVTVLRRGTATHLDISSLSAERNRRPCVQFEGFIIADRSTAIIAVGIVRPSNEHPSARALRNLQAFDRRRRIPPVSVVVDALTAEAPRKCTRPFPAI